MKTSQKKKCTRWSPRESQTGSMCPLPMESGCVALLAHCCVTVCPVLLTRGYLILLGLTLHSHDSLNHWPQGWVWFPALLSCVKVEHITWFKAPALYNHDWSFLLWQASVLNHFISISYLGTHVNHLFSINYHIGSEGLVMKNRYSCLLGNSKDLEDTSWEPPTKARQIFIIQDDLFSPRSN